MGFVLYKINILVLFFLLFDFAYGMDSLSNLLPCNAKIIRINQAEFLNCIGKHPLNSAFTSIKSDVFVVVGSKDYGYTVVSMQCLRNLIDSDHCSKIANIFCVSFIANGVPVFEIVCH